MIAELHCHTKGPKLPYIPFFFDSINTAESIVERCIELNIEILAITDHDSLIGYKQAKEIIKKKKLPIILVPGCEISTLQGHILAYGIEKEIPRKLPAERTIELIHQQKGIAIAAHPYNTSVPHLSLGRRVYTEKIDGMEFSSYATKKANEKTINAGKKINIPVIAGSDAHTQRGIGSSVTIFDDKIKKWQDVIAAIKKGKFEIYGQVQSRIVFGWDHFVGNMRILSGA